MSETLYKSLPACNTSDPAQLRAWYGLFGFAESYRKVVLSNCREIVRARAVAATPPVKLSEARIDDLARTDDMYLDWLAAHLNGRRLYEAEVLAAQSQRFA